ARVRESLLTKLPHLQVLLTGLTADDDRFLRGLHEAPTSQVHDGVPHFTPGDTKARPGSGLLTGRREQFLRLLDTCGQDAALTPLARALTRVLDAAGAPRALVLGGRTLTWGTRTHVMGVVNVTPDSFSDGGRFLAAESAVAHGEALARAGADLLDVGGESTRPGAPPVSADEELARILPVVRGLKERTDVPISVDTSKAVVAKEALAAGAVLVNDISGLHFDPQLAHVVAATGAACCVMHIRGTPETMQREAVYADVVAEVLVWLDEAVERAVTAGVPRDRLLVDPGIGFGKTAGHNLLLLRRLVDLRQLGLPVLVGTSRKSFLGKLAGGKPPSERLAATLGSVAAVAALGGADVVRVHDVAECRDALAVADAIRTSREAGDLFGL
ncbi:MAG: dihydropteroate synthase, partial [Myxococcaceae bacterium]|nr:dihydropteroate synthase [Myxococcaceae bacterium]